MKRIFIVLIGLVMLTGCYTQRFDVKVNVDSAILYGNKEAVTMVIIDGEYYSSFGEYTIELVEGTHTLVYTYIQAHNNYYSYMEDKTVRVEFEVVGDCNLDITGSSYKLY